MDSIADVEIDPHGKFKYILIEVKDKEKNATKLIVRGRADCSYHADILDTVEEKYAAHKSISFNCLGGGRILHNSDAKSIQVFGYSTGYGKADHAKCVEILKTQYPDYDITWSDEGY